MVTTTSRVLLLPSFEIRVNGSPLPLAAEVHVIRVCVDDDVNLPSMFTLEFAGLDDLNRSTIPLIDDSKQFAIAHSVQVKLGYKDALKPVMNGEITGLEPEFHHNCPPSLTVRGYDRRHRLQRGRKTRTFVQQKDSDIVAQIASEAGLAAQAIDTKVTHEYVLQANQTDREFLHERARLIQYEVVVDDTTLHFRPVGNDASPVVTLSLDNDLLEFYPRLSSMGQVSDVHVQGWNPKDKQPLVGKAAGGDEVSTMGKAKSGATVSKAAFGEAIAAISDRSLFSQAEADQIAKAHLNRRVLGLIQGDGICIGHTELRAGKVIQIDGVGQQFSGRYYVTTASHRYGPNGYYTHFTVQRNAL